MMEFLKHNKPPFSMASHSGNQIICDRDGHRVCDCFYSVTAWQLLNLLNATADMLMKPEVQS